MPAAPARSGHVRCIENQSQLITPAELLDLVKLAGVSTDAHKNQSASPWRNPRFDRFGIEAKIFVDVGKHGPHSLVQDRMVRRDEGEGRGNDLVAVKPAVLLFE